MEKIGFIALELILACFDIQQICLMCDTGSLTTFDIGMQVAQASLTIFLKKPSANI